MTWTNTQAASVMLKVSKRTIYNLISQGFIAVKQTENKGLMVWIDDDIKKLVEKRKSRGLES